MYIRKLIFVLAMVLYPVHAFAITQGATTFVGPVTANAGVTGALTDLGGQVYNAQAYGWIPDGTDRSTAALALLTTIYNAGGGTIYFPPSKTAYRADSQLLIPNNGGSTYPAQQNIRMTGAGSAKGWGSSSGSATLDLRYQGTGGKILTLAGGNLQIDHLNITDGGTSNTTPFIYTTQTVLTIKDNYFNGTGNVGQDAIVLGGTTTISSNSITCPFEGYGTVIDNNTFNDLQRGVYGRAYANEVIVTNNSWINMPSGALDAIEFDGSVGGIEGVYMSGNIIEVNAYVYGIKFTNTSESTLINNYCWDGAGPFVSCYDFVTSSNNAVIDPNATAASFTTDTTSLHTLTVVGKNYMSTNNVDTNTITGGYSGLVDVVSPLETNVSTTSNTVYGIDAGMTYSGTLGGDALPYQYNATFNNVVENSGWLYGNSYVTYLSGTTTVGNGDKVLNFLARPYMETSGNINFLSGFEVDPYFYTSGSTGTVSTYEGLTLTGGSYGGGATSAVTTWNQVHIQNPSTSVPITNIYGLNIDAISGGITNNYAIYSAGGNDYLNGNVGILATPTTDALRVGNGTGSGQVNVAINGAAGNYNGYTIRAGGTEYIGLLMDGTDSTNDFILRQNAATNTIRSVASGAVANTLVLNAGKVGLGVAASSILAGLDEQLGITDAAGSGYGFRTLQNITTAANSDNQYGAYLGSTFLNTGSYTGVTDYGLYVNPTFPGSGTTNYGLVVTGGISYFSSGSNPIVEIGTGSASNLGSGVLQVNGLETSTGSNAQLVIGNGDDGATTKNLFVGYDTTNDRGYIQAIHQGSAYTNLILENKGGDVGMGGAVSPDQALTIGSTTIGGNEDIYSTIGSDLVTGGTTWTSSGTGSVVTGSGTTVTASGTASGTETAQPSTPLTITIGNTYLVSFTTSAVTGTLQWTFAGQTVHFPTASTNYSYYWTATGTGNLIFNSGTSGTQTWTVSNINIQLISKGTLTANNGVLTTGWSGFGTSTPTAQVDIEQNIPQAGLLFTAQNSDINFGGGVQFSSNNSDGAIYLTNYLGAQQIGLLNTTGGWQFNNQLNIIGTFAVGTSGGALNLSVTTAGNLSTSGTIATTNATASTSTTTGAIVDAGGLGVAGAEHISGNFITDGQIVGDSDLLRFFGGSATTNPFRFDNNNPRTDTSGSTIFMGLFPTYDQASGTAANTDLLISRTETAIGSGAQYLIQAQTGGVNEFTVTDTGVVTAPSLKTGLIFPSADSTTAVQIDKADGATNVLDVDTTNGRVGIGLSSLNGGKLEILSTTEQLRLDYDATHYASFTVASTGSLTLGGTTGNFTATKITSTRIARRVGTSSAPGATPSLNTDNYDEYSFTGLATGITSMTTNLTGTPATGDLLEIIFTDNGTSQTIIWGASFASSGTIFLPSATVISTPLSVMLEWNGSAWICKGVA